MFLNSVCEIAADVPPQELHQHLMKIESALGRPRIRGKNEPRTLDLDLLYAGDWVSDDPALTVPHPRLHLREFVLRPLADFRPNLVLPGQTQTIIELLAALPDDPDMRLLEGAALVEVG